MYKAENLVVRVLSICLLLFVGVLCVRADQPPEILYASSPGSFIFVNPVTNSEVLANASVSDAAGNVYVTGSFMGTATFGTNILNSSGGFNYDDIYLVKYDPAGNVLWARRAGGSGKDFGTAITLDGAGGVYLSGTSDSLPCTFGSIVISNYYASMFIARYDGNGNALWVQRGGAYNKPPLIYAAMTITGVARDAANNVIVAGSFTGNPSIGNAPDAQSNSTSIFLTNKNATVSSAYSDLFLAKFAANGTMLWATNYGGTNSEFANSVAVDSTGAIYVAGGYTLNTVIGAQVYTNLTAGILFCKFSPTGALVWSSNLSDATNSNPGVGLSVVVNSADRVTLSLQGFNSSAAFKYQGTSNALAFGDINLLAQFDVNDNLQWFKQTIFSASGPSSMATDKQNNIYLGSNAGFTNNSVPALSLTVLKMNSAGQPLWTNVVRNPGTGVTLGSPAISIDDSYVTHVTGTLTGGEGSALTVGWTNYYPFTAFGKNQLIFAIASNFVAVPPYFVQQPTNMFFQPPKGLTNSAQARAWPAPVYYWYQTATRLTNSTNFTITISPTTFTNRTTYFVIASNAYGMATSSVVNAQAGIAFVSQPPANVGVLQGTTLAISGTTTGTSTISYQWQYNGTNITNANGPALTLQNMALSQSGNYTLIISNATGSLTSSPPSIVTVLPYGAIDPGYTNNLIAPLSMVRSPDGGFHMVNAYNAYHVTANGLLDTNFISAYRWNDGSSPDIGLGPQMIVREPDGKLIVGGNFKVYYTNVSTFTNISHIARLNTNGTLDTTFNVGGGATNTTDGANYAFVNSVVRLPNGQYLVGGIFNRWNGIPATNLVRLNNDGSFDNTFPIHSFKNLNGGYANGEVRSVVLQADGKILVGGAFDLIDNIANHCLTRLNTNGTTDSSFVQNYISPSPFARVNKLLPLADGRIMAIGAWSNLGNRGALRFNSDGSRDTNWVGVLGVESYDILLLMSNKFLFTGNSFVRRTTFDGVTDPTFVTNTFFNSQFTYTAALEPSGNVMVGGSFGLRRLLLEPTPIILPSLGNGNTGAIVNGQYQFSACGGIDGQTIVVQATTDLVNWINVSTNVVSGGCINFIDPQLPHLPNRYYRLSTP